MHAFLTFLDLSGLVMLGLYFLQTLVAALLPIPRRHFLAESPLHFTFLIPALNEASVIAATIRNLRREVPEAHIAVIDDASADATPDIVRAIAATDSHVQLLRREFPQAQEGKGKALNWAVSQLLTQGQRAGASQENEIFAVIDADGRITPQLIPEARAALADPDVMGAQCRVRIRPSGRLSARNAIGHMLEQQQDLEFFIVRHLQLLRTRWQSVGFSGNGQFMRASYLQRQLARGQMPWPDVLLEDFASSVEMRLAAPGYKMAWLDAAVTQQGLPHFSRFIRQRARWTQGNLQCLPYVPLLMKSSLPFLVRLDFIYFIISPWLNLIIVTSFLMQPVRWLLDAQGLVLDARVSLVITVFNILMQLQWVARYQLENRLSFSQVLFTLTSLPVYGFALFLSLPMAYTHHLTGRRTWDKSARHLEATE